MSKVTTKLQVTLPKALAEQYSIRPGDEIEWQAAADVIRVIPGKLRKPPDRARRVQLFDRATERQRERNRRFTPSAPGSSRGWQRADLYDRGRSG